MRIVASVNTDRDLKLWMPNPQTLKVKVSIAENIHVIHYDLQHYRKGIVYTNRNSSDTSPLQESYIVDIPRLSEPEQYFNFHGRNHFVDEYYGIGKPEPGDYPLYLYLGPDQTEVDESATKTIVFPPPETHLEFMERIQSRLLHLTRRSSVLRHEQPHLSERSRRVCLDLDDRSEYVHRYDHAINLLRLPVGWLQNMINAYQAQWNAHLERVEAAKKKNQPEPTFTRLNDRDDIETLLEKLENRLTEETLIDHHETHDTTEWQNAHASRKIVLCNDDCSVGEEIADINSFHTARGVTNHRLAEKSFHDVAVTYWNQALQTPYRKLVTRRTFTLD